MRKYARRNRRKSEPAQFPADAFLFVRDQVRKEDQAPPAGPGLTWFAVYTRRRLLEFAHPFRGEAVITATSDAVQLPTDGINVCSLDFPFH